MGKKLKNLAIFIFFMAAAIYFHGCSSKVMIQEPCIGVITIVGNDPFTKLAINVNDKDVYLLECSDALKKELWKNQGRIYQIIYSEVKKTEAGISLVVQKAISLTTN